MHFEAYVQRQFGLSIKVFHSDSGIELKGLKLHLALEWCFKVFVFSLYTCSKWRD